MSDFSRAEQQRRDMEDRLPEVQAKLQRLANVEAVTIGAKEVNGVATSQLAFQVYVRVKKSAVELPADERIPTEIFGFPTDVILIEEVTPTEDTSEYRPLAGGIPLNSGEGTLGMIVLTTLGGATPAGTPVVLTNSHVTPTVGKPIGQPGSPSDCRCSACCDVGTVVASTITTLVDAAIATLNSDVRHTHEIVDVGAVRGWVSATTMRAGDVVFKRGCFTKLREGRFSTATAPRFTRSDGKTFSNQIRVTSPPPIPPSTTPIPFQLGGDSGSVLLDASHRVIGLMHGASLPAGTPAFANRIEDVRTAVNIDIPLMGTAGAVPLSSVHIEPHDAVTEGLRRLAAVYGRRDAGRIWRELVQRHRDEVARLVRDHRATTTTWHRYHGPSFVSHYMKTVRDKGYLAPEEIGGIRVENLLLGMAAVLQEHGSPTLSRAIWRHYLQIIESAKDCRSVEAFIDRLTQSSPTENEIEPDFSDSEVSVG